MYTNCIPCLNTGVLRNPRNPKNIFQVQDDITHIDREQELANILIATKGIEMAITLPTLTVPYQCKLDAKGYYAYRHRL